MVPSMNVKRDLGPYASRRQETTKLSGNFHTATDPVENASIVKSKERRVP